MSECGRRPSLVISVPSRSLDTAAGPSMLRPQPPASPSPKALSPRARSYRRELKLTNGPAHPGSPLSGRDACRAGERGSCSSSPLSRGSASPHGSLSRWSSGSAAQAAGAARALCPAAADPGPCWGWGQRQVDDSASPRPPPTVECEGCRKKAAMQGSQELTHVPSEVADGTSIDVLAALSDVAGGALHGSAQEDRARRFARFAELAQYEKELRSVYGGPRASATTSDISSVSSTPPPLSPDPRASRPQSPSLSRMPPSPESASPVQANLTPFGGQLRTPAKGVCASDAASTDWGGRAWWLGETAPWWLGERTHSPRGEDSRHIPADTEEDAARAALAADAAACVSLEGSASALKYDASEPPASGIAAMWLGWTWATKR